MKKLLLLSTIMLLPWSKSANAVTVKVDDQPETVTTTTTATTYTLQRQAPQLDENTKTLLKLMYEEKQLRKISIDENGIIISEINNNIINNLKEQLIFKTSKLIVEEIENRKGIENCRISRDNYTQILIYQPINKIPFITKKIFLWKSDPNFNLIYDYMQIFQEERMRKLRKLDFSSVKGESRTNFPKKPKDTYDSSKIEAISRVANLPIIPLKMSTPVFGGIQNQKNRVPNLKIDEQQNIEQKISKLIKTNISNYNNIQKLNIHFFIDYNKTRPDQIVENDKKKLYLKDINFSKDKACSIDYSAIPAISFNINDDNRNIYSDILKISINYRVEDFEKLNDFYTYISNEKTKEKSIALYQIREDNKFIEKDENYLIISNKDNTLEHKITWKILGDPIRSGKILSFSYIQETGVKLPIKGYVFIGLEPKDKGGSGAQAGKIDFAQNMYNFKSFSNKPYPDQTNLTYQVNVKLD